MYRFYIIAASIVIFFFTSIFVKIGSQEVLTIKISEKQVIPTNDKTDSFKYLIFTDGEVFENTDDVMFLKFNSSDIENELKVDSMYTVKVVGYRIPILSHYRNIISIQK